MEYRKLISFGKNSFVISLPKPWIKQNKLKKGDLVYVEETATDLHLQARPIDPAQIEREITISVDGKDLNQIKREVFGAYIRNNKTITLSGNEIKDKAEDLQLTIQSLVALEVMEQTSKTIVAKDFLNMDSVSTKTIIRKIDVITRSMWEDCTNMFEVDVCENINFRDRDVNKLSFLMFKIVRFGLENTSYMLKKFNLDPLALMSLWWISYDLESVADEVKRIARYMRKVKLSRKSQEVYKKILQDVKSNYCGMMKAYYDGDVNTVYILINQRYDLISRCEKFHIDNLEVEWLGYLIERTKASIGHITHIGRILYQGKTTLQ